MKQKNLPLVIERIMLFIKEQEKSKSAQKVFIDKLEEVKNDLTTEKIEELFSKNFIRQRVLKNNQIHIDQLKNELLEFSEQDNKHLMKDLLNNELKQWTEVISDEEIEEFLDVSVSYIDHPSEQKAEEIQGFFFGDMANGLIEKLDLIKDKKHKN